MSSEISSKKLWSELMIQGQSNPDIRNFVREQNYLDSVNRLPAMMLQCEELWDLIPAAIQRSLANNVYFYVALVHQFDFSKPDPVLRGPPMDAVSRIVMEHYRLECGVE